MSSTTLGTSSIAFLPSRYLSSPSSNPSTHTLSLSSGILYILLHSFHVFFFPCFSCFGHYVIVGIYIEMLSLQGKTVVRSFMEELELVAQRESLGSLLLMLPLKLTL
jgi:hypothetical protein